MSIYNPGIPTGTVNLDQDYKNIQNNFSQLDTSFGVDHTKFSANPTSPVLNGYHNIIHQGPQTNSPSAIVGIGQTYVKAPAGDTQLYFRTGGGSVNRLTGNSASTNGYQYMGMTLLQWGVATISATGNQTVSVVFPNTNFTQTWNVQVSFIAKNGGTSSSNASISVIGNTVNTLGFSASVNMSDTSAFTSFYWIAFGLVSN